MDRGCRYCLHPKRQATVVDYDFEFADDAVVVADGAIRDADDSEDDPEADDHHEGDLAAAAGEVEIVAVAGVRVPVVDAVAVVVVVAAVAGGVVYRPAGTTLAENLTKCWRQERSEQSICLSSNPVYDRPVQTM